jgi:vacuolar protein sorting-associated protein 16
LGLSERTTRHGRKWGLFCWRGAAWNAWCATGPYGDWLQYNYEAGTSLVLVTEIDGIRIISNKTHEFLQRVPAKTEAIFKTGSMHPAAMLYDATVAFHEKSPKADEHIR